MLCQVVLLFHFLSSCFFFYFSGSKLEHSTLQSNRREFSVGLEQKEAPHGQTTHIPHSGDSGELLRSSGGCWLQPPPAPESCCAEGSLVRGRKVHREPHIMHRGLSQAGKCLGAVHSRRWYSRDTARPAVSPTFRCCRRAVAALLFFCGKEK